MPEKTGRRQKKRRVTGHGSDVGRQRQQKVIDLRDRNILVSAAAGSGKTAVLVERIIQRDNRCQHGRLMWTGCLL